MKDQKVLIAGSREMTNSMVKHLRRYFVREIVNSKAQIIVGDNPHGVDAEVIELTATYGVSCTVYGVTMYPRKELWNGQQYYVVETKPNDSWAYQYRQRDEHLVDMADRVLCIWDGQSRGTLAVYKYAVSQGKDVLLFKPVEGQMVLVDEHRPEEGIALR